MEKYEAESKTDFKGLRMRLICLIIIEQKVQVLTSKPLAGTSLATNIGRDVYCGTDQLPVKPGYQGTPTFLFRQRQ